MLGLMNPWVLLGALATAVTLALGSYFYGVNAGVDKTEVVWQAREAKINAASALAISAANDRVRATERKAADTLAGVATNYENRIKEKDREKTIALNAARTNGLFIATPGRKSCRDTVSTTNPGTGISNGPEVVRLPSETATALLDLGSEADRVAEQLTACQAVVKADRGE